MPSNRILIALIALTLAACAGIEKPAPAAAPDISLRPDTDLSARRGKGPAKPAPLPARPVDSGPENSVHFGSGEARVDEQDQERLRRLALRLKDNPQQVVTLVGYCDPLGSPSYNLAITEERLDAVAEFLRSLGVGRGQIRRVNKGQTRAAGDCGNPECLQAMRRIELIYDN